MVLNRKLKELREKQNLSQQEVAEKLLVSRQAVSRWESGTTVPTTENLGYLSRLYGVSLEYLLNDEASAPVCAEPEAEKEKFKEAVNRKRGKYVLVLIAIGVIAVLLFTTYIWNKKQEEKPVSINDIAGGEATAGMEFEMEW